MRRWPHRGFCLASCSTSSRHLARDRRASVAFRIGPLVLDQAPMPGAAGCRVSRSGAAAGAWAAAAPGSAITARSAQSGRGRATCRRSTATSCRSTRISASLAASLRARSASQPNTRTMNRQMRRISTSADRKAAGQAMRRVLAQHRPTDHSHRYDPVRPPLVRTAVRSAPPAAGAQHASRPLAGQPAQLRAVDDLVDRLVHDVTGPLAGELAGQRPAHLLRAPPLLQPADHEPAQHRVRGDLARTRPGAPLHGQLVRRERAVLAAVRIPVTPQFPADRGRSAARLLRDRPHSGPAARR